MRYMNPAKPPKKAPATKPTTKMNYGGMPVVEGMKVPPMMNKGGAVKKHKMPDDKMAKGSKPAIAIVIGVGKPMAKKKK